MERQIIELSKRINSLENILTNGLQQSLSAQAEDIKELTRILKGDPDLGVAPLRDDLQSLKEEVRFLRDIYNRAKWVAILLAGSNAGAIFTWLSAILG